jgi:hypothetical protein
VPRFESSVTSVSWIPKEAIEGVTKLPFELGIGHYDLPPSDRLENAAALVAAGGARFANELRAFVEVEDGRIVRHGHLGTGHMGWTRMRFGPLDLRFTGTPFPELRPPAEVGEDSVTFVQTAGGRPGMPAPRWVARAPYLQVVGPIVWSTLSLTIHADGTSEATLVGCSKFPRHWVFDDSGAMIAKTGLIDFEGWYREAFGEASPWGGEESPAVVSAVESALERELSKLIIDSDPPFRRLRPGELLVEQGEPGDELFLLFDGMLEVIRDGEKVTEVGPGAILGEMALLEGGNRTATLRALTACRVAVVPGDRVDRQALVELAGRRRPAAAGPDGLDPDGAGDGAS